MSSPLNSPYSRFNQGLNNNSRLSNQLVYGESSSLNGSVDSNVLRVNLGSNSNPNDFITYIIPDFDAVTYFQKDFQALNEFHLCEESEASGFEIYLVEQWMNDRNISSVVTTFTGNESSKISVVRFTILKKPAKYYPLRFQEYLNELIQNHSRMKRIEKEKPTYQHSRTNSNSEMLTLSKLSTTQIPKRESSSDYTSEVCFVANLTSLPSNLNLIPVPGGDSRKVSTAFMINSNLKKLQCTGRSVSMITSKISDASDDKFRQMYKIQSTKVPIVFAAKELVNIVQTCLFYFDLLDAKYCNGLLCTKTEEAITNWWNLIGLPHFSVKPNPVNGILPSRTVAAIVSLILSVRMRIQLVGSSDVPKDPFDFENFMIAIGQFQRQYKLDKTRKLDMETLNKLFTVTNARLLPQKNTNYFYSQVSTGSDLDPQSFDIISQSGNPKGLDSTSQKRRYGKELKKLTNVMKSSVLDRINAASVRDIDDMLAPSKASSGRIRNKIAKLADTVSPLDVETLDLEFLVKKHLNGKTLIRLFYGTQSSNTFLSVEKSSDPQNKGHRHNLVNTHNSHLAFPKRRGRTMVENSSTLQYKFESLRDKIAQTQELVMINDPSRYSRGLNRMKLGLQSKKNPLTGGEKNSMLLTPGGNYYSSPMQTASLVDSFLQISNDDASGVESVCSKPNSINRRCVNSVFDFKHPLASFKHNLNRRNSFPYLENQHEQNLNTLVIAKNQSGINFEEIDLLKRKRSISFSCVEDAVLLGKVQAIGSMTKFSQSFLDSIRVLMKYESLKSYYLEGEKKEKHVTNQQLNKLYQLMNLELIKMKNLRNQMDAHQSRIMEGGIEEELHYSMKTLNTTIDRLVYETRIVAKRIDELEQDFKLYEMKLNDECKSKLTEIIDKVLHLKQFKEVFTSPEERKQIAYKLTGDENYIKFDDEKESIGLLRMIVMFFYGIILSIFRFFHFNRDNMNLERIRQAWVILDPNRSIIKHAYSYIGREPSKDSIASTDSK